VVVNDLGVELDGTGTAQPVAQQVVDEIERAGGRGLANTDDVADWDASKRMIDAALDAFGRLDVLVNNAGILRDRMLFNMSVEEWDAVIHVHLRGTFCPTRHAAAYWRERAKAGETLDVRVINTTSASGIYGNPGQSNYGAAKAGIAAFTVIASRELERYGVTVNAVSPGARTRMTESAGIDSGGPDGDWDPREPSNVAPIVAWLAGPESAGITGRVFESAGGRIGVAEGWRRGPSETKQGRWNPAELGPVIRRLLGAAAAPEQMRSGASATR
jgi:NAD(P)-dependent dehydrogenase (short-subunit alcohol dehydrogenase family)